MVEEKPQSPTFAPAKQAKNRQPRLHTPDQEESQETRNLFHPTMQNETGYARM